LIELPQMKADFSHQAKRIRVTWIDRQSALAQISGFRRKACLQETASQIA
jgi:hypothetical protein